MFDNDQIQKMYDRFSSMPWFWEIDAVTCRATQDSPYRDRAIELLELSPKSSVLDVACGTGLNFKLLQRALEARGSLVGVDLSEKTLELARRRVAKQGWTNVKLVECNVAEYQPEQSFDAALCTFAIEIIPPYREALDMMLAAVRPGGRIGVIGFQFSKKPLLSKLNPFFAWMSVWFGGVDMDRDVRGYLGQRTREVSFEERYGGFYYILIVEKPLENPTAD